MSVIGKLESAEEGAVGVVEPELEPELDPDDDDEDSEEQLSIPYRLSPGL